MRTLTLLESLCLKGELGMIEEIQAMVSAERERCAKLVEEYPERVLVMYDRPGGAPGNTYVHVTGQKLLAQAIRSLSN